MASYVLADIQNSNIFSNFNTQIRYLHELFRVKPHIASHLSYTIRDATQDDLYLPYSLIGIARVIDIQITEKLCNDVLSCVNTTQDKILKENDLPEHYRVGTDAINVAGRPSCYNLRDKPRFSENNVRSLDMIELHYHNNQCHYVTPMKQYLEKPLFRDDRRYAPLKNDMPTGFTLTTSSETQTGQSFSLNKDYCLYYNKIFDGKECNYTKTQLAFSPIVSPQLINTVTSAVTKGLPGGRQELPKDLPALPTKIPDEYTYSGWLKNINKTFKLPEINNYNITENEDDEAKVVKLKQTLYNLKSKHYTNKTHYTNHRTEIYYEIKRLEKDIKERHDNVIINNEKTNLNNRNSDKTNSATIADNHELRGNEVVEDIENIIEKIGVFLKDLISGVISDPKQILLIYGIDQITEATLDKFRVMCVKIIEVASNLILKQAINMSLKIGEKTFFGAFTSCFFDIVVFVGVKIVGNSIILLAKMCAGLASVVGILLTVVCILDIIFALWDPYGYNNQLNSKFVHDLYLQGERALRTAYKSPNPVLTFDQLIMLTLPEETLLKIRLESFADRLYYLDALAVNSEGSVIDKGDVLVLGGLKNENDKLYNTVSKTSIGNVEYGLPQIIKIVENLISR